MVFGPLGYNFMCDGAGSIPPKAKKLHRLKNSGDCISKMIPTEAPWKNSNQYTLGNFATEHIRKWGHGGDSWSKAYYFSGSSYLCRAYPVRIRKNPRNFAGIRCEVYIPGACWKSFWTGLEFGNPGTVDGFPNSWRSPVAVGSFSHFFTTGFVWHPRSWSPDFWTSNSRYDWKRSGLSWMFFLFLKTKGPERGRFFFEGWKKGETFTLTFAGKSGWKKPCKYFRKWWWKSWWFYHARLDSVKKVTKKHIQGFWKGLGGPFRNSCLGFCFCFVFFFGGVKKNIFNVQRSEPPRNIPRTFHSHFRRCADRNSLDYMTPWYIILEPQSPPV